MIRENRNTIARIVDAITPSALKQATASIEVSGAYDWKQEAGVCRFGTTQSTSIGTSYGGCQNMDTNTDSVTD